MSRSKNILIDNYDSFTYNLVQYFGELGEDFIVYRNDEVTVKELQRKKIRRIVISPGPCTPDKAGISVDVVKNFAGKVPLLGVCLGHQCIASAFSAKIVRAKRLMHGKTSMIEHNGRDIFKRLPNPFEATRYHSLVIKKDTLPSNFEITAYSEDGEIMGIADRKLKLYGVQFHPESILTKCGKELLKNFLEIK
ncbi:MAG: aminodeoxychorismate/anthranilate synthase component II [Candidatus Schekmanbacteria bacterium]|nr:MAG: aminodeoxychorismate/anthranilate synthase component II [Candidatus Schekmanbacteria bacterium]